ncbi:flavin reductase family protein [Actibacterium sp. XHP0104]|uniref:flavin reductase family protein n=1 Tax=Actibacterium sp. XHP0104 TaxID=2984335 RepID=UPI0021E8F0D4|nr:flavin reductase family protein [Actibacterium sp. XHP0104]MCV2880557.1 flavin reductase family protein [Actibacterium sp. XHP0104]
MFYRPQDGHGLPHNPFNAIIAPRPIAWVSTRGADGQDNLAPFSFFNGAAYSPPQIMFATTGTKPDGTPEKDTLAHIRATGVFCVNMVEYAMMHPMNESSGGWPREVDEFDKAGIAKADCETIPCPRIAGAPASLECKLTQIVQLEGKSNNVIFGQVTGVHLRDDCLRDGKFDITTFGALARLGYRDYATITETFTLTRPDD